MTAPPGCPDNQKHFLLAFPILHTGGRFWHLSVGSTTWPLLFSVFIAFIWGLVVGLTGGSYKQMRRIQLVLGRIHVFVKINQRL